MKRLLSLLLTICLLLTMMPMAYAEHTHTYAESARTDATCTTEGSVTYTCSCGDSYTETLPLAEHQWEYSQASTGTTKHHMRVCSECGTGASEACDITTATCTSPSECTKCGYRFAEALGHNYVESARTDATCTTDGSVTYTCDREGCGDSYTEKLAATGHDQRGGKALKEATCTEPTTQYVICSKCGAQQVNETSGEALGHNYVETARTESTCLIKGSVTYTCNREGCGDSYTEELPLVDHDYVATVYPATCQEPEIHVDECSMCGEWVWDTLQYVGETLPHEYVENDRIEPTCTTDGMVSYMCKNCEDMKEETLAATGHDQDGPTMSVEATCTEPATEYVACSKCGEMQVLSTSGEALGHNYVEIARVDATCTTDGSVTYTCTREGCGNTYTDTVTAPGHSYETITREATCTEPGESHEECSVCGDTINSTPIEALGHNYVETARKNATCTEKGSVTYTCDREDCGDSYTDPLKAKGHSWTTSDGYTYTCTRCGLTEVDEEAKAEAEATPIPDALGEANENGDLTDLTLTSAIKQVGGGYSLRREEATLNSITLAAEKDPENSWMRLTAAEPATQLGMLASYIGDKMTLTLTENDEELKITGVTMNGTVLTITTSSGAVFELSTPSVSLGYTELDTIAEKNLDRIIFTRSGNLLLIDFGSAEALKAEAEAALATPTPEVTPSPTPSPTPRPTYTVTITFSKATIRREATPTPEVVIETEEEEECVIVIIAYDDEEEVETYERNICPHRWKYDWEDDADAEKSCQSSRTCELCGLHEDTPSDHCWYAYQKIINGTIYDMGVQTYVADDGETAQMTEDMVSMYIMKCRYCDATKEEKSLNQAQGICTHSRLSESNTRVAGAEGDNVRTTWCTTAMQCPDCRALVAAVGHKWKITGEQGDYYTAVCQRCGQTVKANKKFYNSEKGKLDTSEMSCADDPNNHSWVVVQSSGCKQVLVCTNCGEQATTDHAWKVTRPYERSCDYTAVCQKCGKTEKVTFHTTLNIYTRQTGKTKGGNYYGDTVDFEYQVYVGCQHCGKTIASRKCWDSHDLGSFKTSKKEIKQQEKLKKELGVDEFPVTYTLPLYLTDGYINSQSQ